MINRRNFLQKMSVLAGAGWATVGLGTGIRLHPAVLQEPPADANWDWWRDLPRTPLETSDDPVINKLCRTAAGRRQVTMIYDGGSEPHAPRRIAPLGVFEVEGYAGVYVLAFCLKRKAERTFRTDRIFSIV